MSEDVRRAHEHDHTQQHSPNLSACDGCGHCHHGEGKEESKVVTIVTMALAGICLVLGLLPMIPTIGQNLLLAGASLLAGYPVLIAAVKGLLKFRLDENLLVAIAVIAASAIGDFAEAAAVTLFFRAGELFEDFAVNRSKKSIAALSEIRPDTAHITVNGALKAIPAQDVQPGQVITVLPFERVPLDGTVITGASTLDASAITGESVPVEAQSGFAALSGMINGSNTLEIEVTNSYGQSAASRIIKMVEEAASRKANTERTVSKFARYYTPAVVLLALVLAILPPLFTGEWILWLNRALVFLVASCPCALVLSVPLSFFAGIGAASKRGVLVKGGGFIEALAKADTIVFDKTGTLTTGELSVYRTYTAPGVEESRVQTLAAGCEYYSSHPIAKAIVSSFGRPEEQAISGFCETAGNGTSAVVNGVRVTCGSKGMMERAGIDISALPDAQVYVCAEDHAIGAIEVTGTVREDARQTVEALRELGVKRIVMLTGDNEQAAKQTAEHCSITEYRAGLLPEDKVRVLEELKQESVATAFVGDGINDAPVLTAADIGVAMGLGTDAAIEAGDIVLTNNNPSRLPDAIRLFRRTMGIVKFNIGFALAVKAVVLILGATGFAFMWAAVFADVGVSVLAVLNASRILRVKKN